MGPYREHEFLTFFNFNLNVFLHLWCDEIHGRSAEL